MHISSSHHGKPRRARAGSACRRRTLFTPTQALVAPSPRPSTALPFPHVAPAKGSISPCIRPRPRPPPPRPCWPSRELSAQVEDEGLAYPHLTARPGYGLPNLVTHWQRVVPIHSPTAATCSCLGEQLWLGRQPVDETCLWSSALGYTSDLHDHPPSVAYLPRLRTNEARIFTVGDAVYCTRAAHALSPQRRVSST